MKDFPEEVVFKQNLSGGEKNIASIGIQSPERA